jgi:hypothetical protein
MCWKQLHDALREHDSLITLWLCLGAMHSVSSKARKLHFVIVVEGCLTRAVVGVATAANNSALNNAAGITPDRSMPRLHASIHTHTTSPAFKQLTLWSRECQHVPSF